jgi:hypothetical protein
MKHIFVSLVALTSLPLAARAKPQDPVSLAREVLQEIQTRWKAAVEVDGKGNFPDISVVKISFSNCHSEEVTDAVLPRLKVFPRLRQLTINSEVVSEEGLRHLQELPHLRELTLIRVPLTAKGIDILMNLPHLRRLTLFRIDITRGTLPKLREALPRTTVSWRGP